MIGAGASGLITIKELLEEGHNVVCYEKHDKIGGVFYYSEFKGGVYDSTLLTVSNYMMAYSCFPPDFSEDRKYWSFQEYVDYLYEFIDHFGLEKHIRLNSEVRSIRRLGKGQCEVQVVERGTNEVKTHLFDCVAVCSGANQQPRRISIRGEDQFEGEILHSANYRNADEFQAKRVLCVGIGETGSDVTHEIAQVATDCILSIRHYQSLVERYPAGREHTSDAYTTYAIGLVCNDLGNQLAVGVHKAIIAKSENPMRRALADWNLKSGNYSNQVFTKNEIFLRSVVEKKLTVNASGIDRLEKNSVVFNDGEEREIDVIMLNTGYQVDFSFIKDADIKDMRQNYRHMIHPDLGEDVVFIGWARPNAGSVPACSEMQSRYFALLCSEKLQLLDTETLKRDIERQTNYEDQLFHRSPEVRSLVNYTRYMDDFAKHIGCSPWRLRTFLNPKLLYRLIFGSQLSCIYRLYGPHSQYNLAKRTIYNLPVGYGLREVVFICVMVLISKIGTKLGALGADPKY